MARPAPPAIGDAIGPRQQRLASAAVADRVDREPVEHLDLTDPVGAQARTHLGDDGLPVAQGQDELLT